VWSWSEVSIMKLTPREAGIQRWLCQIYFCRGRIERDEDWLKFRDFCVENNFDWSPLPGKRADGRSDWDVYEEDLQK